MIIRDQQIEELEKGVMSEFEDEMVLHLAEFSPPLYEVIKEDQMRSVVRFGLKQANKYGLTLRGPIRLYLEMMLLFGSHFDKDPQYPWAGEILIDRHSVSEMQRAEWLHEKILDYQQRVSGPDAENARAAQEKILALARGQTEYPSSEFEEAITDEIYRVFPQKADYVGKKSLASLIRIGRSQARKYDFPSTRGDVLMVALMFSFGYGASSDPLYPWIRRTLKDDKIIEPAARMERLRKKATTWLEHVLDGSKDIGEI